MNNPDYRAMCAELVELSAPVDSISQLTERLQKLNELADRARALLAEPVAVGPSDEDLDELFTEIDQGGEALSWRAYARAVLAKWGRPAAAPAPEPGEVAELVAALEADAECAEAEHYDLCNMTADQMLRAATLLQQQAAPVPGAGEVQP